MNPTLWDASVLVQCQRCEVQTRVDAEVVRQTASDKTIVCWHCGFRSQSPPEKIERLPPDRLLVVINPGAPIAPGDLVVFAHSTTTETEGPTTGAEVKRVLAVEGQCVSADPTGRLLVDGCQPTFERSPKISGRPRPRDEITRSGRSWVAVDDTRLDVTTSHNLPAYCRWQVDEEGYWTYSHRSVYRNGRPIAILDDYPSNWHVDRTLHPADRIALTVDLPTTPKPYQNIQFKCRGWQISTNSGQTETLTIEPNDHEIRVVLDRVDHREESSSIAFRINRSDEPLRGDGVQRAIPSRIRIDRALVYRVDDRGPDFSSVVLNKNELFVVGDNVPVSVDSRHRGPVHASAVLGLASGLLSGLL